MIIEFFYTEYSNVIAITCIFICIIFYSDNLFSPYFSTICIHFAFENKFLYVHYFILTWLQS